MEPLLTAHLITPVATQEAIRNEIRRAVEEGRAPQPMPAATTNLTPIGTPVYQQMPGASTTFTAFQPSPIIPLLDLRQPTASAPASVPSAQTPAQIPAPLSPALTPAQVWMRRGLALGGGLLAGLGIMYVLRR